jgi:hypothetical protein
VWKHDENFRTNEGAWQNSAEHDGHLVSLGLQYKVEDKFIGKRKQKATQKEVDL